MLLWKYPMLDAFQLIRLSMAIFSSINESFVMKVIKSFTKDPKF
ncbi:hypothetical protein CsSME_00015120 [Camellia sinensis var. sinensis]